MKPPHILFLTAEAWPTFRVDVAVLFGKYLPRHGVTCDLVTEQDRNAHVMPDWPAGKAFLTRVPGSRGLQYLLKFGHELNQLLRADARRYSAIQVRDMPFIALFAMWIAHHKGLPFFYWMSFPQSEGNIARARARGPRAGMRYWFPLFQGLLGKWVLYRLVLPRTGHIFVQSEQMLLDVARHGIAPERMTAVPMAVDHELVQAADPTPVDDARLSGKRVIVYLGALDAARRIDILFDALVLLRQRMPDAVLLLVGDTEDAGHRQWLRGEAQRKSVDAHVIWTGWLPMTEAWRHVRAAQIGVSPVPRGALLDCGSPTKAIEYLALGVPALVNDNPDQEKVILESGGGLCRAFEAQAFADGMHALLADNAARAEMAVHGRAYVLQHRSYARLAEALAQDYQRLCKA